MELNKDRYHILLILNLLNNNLIINYNNNRWYILVMYHIILRWGCLVNRMDLVHNNSSRCLPIHLNNSINSRFSSKEVPRIMLTRI